MSALAESVGQAVNSWPAVALATVTLVGGWGTLIIKTWVEASKARDTAKDTGDSVKEIKEQVLDGGVYDTNLRQDVAKGLQLMEFAVSHIKNLPTHDDIKRLDGRIDKLGERVGVLEQQGGGYGGKAHGMT